MVPSTITSMLGSIPGLRPFLYPTIFTVRRFLTVYGSRFALTASGGSCGGLSLRLVGSSALTAVVVKTEFTLLIIIIMLAIRQCNV